MSSTKLVKLRKKKNDLKNQLHILDNYTEESHIFKTLNRRTFALL